MDSHPDADLYPPDYDPDAPVTHDHAGGVHHTHPYPGIDHDARPVLDPEPIPNIVLHPGDAIAIGAYADAGSGSSLRLLDRNGHCYAVLDCDYDPSADTWRIDAIRFVSHLGGRELLPVRPEPDAQPDLETVPVTVDGETVDYTIPIPQSEQHSPTIAFSQPDALGTTAVGASALSVTHAHPHRHHDARGGLTHPHLHNHTHAGAGALRTALYGHDDDVHDDHPHAHLDAG